MGTAVFFLPFAAGVYVLAEPLVKVIFERGSFDESSTLLTVSALRIFAPAIIALGLNDLLGFVFHSRQEPDVPMKAGLIRVGLNIVLCALMIHDWGHRGIAFAFTAASFLKLVVLTLFLRRVLPTAELFATFRDLWRAAAATLVMVTAVYFTIRVPTAGGAYLQLVAGASAGAVSYLVALRLFHKEEFELYRDLLRAVFRRARVTERFDTAGYKDAPTYPNAGEKIG
jgi:putative peptidoglycan lipid II flippase